MNNISDKIKLTIASLFIAAAISGSCYTTKNHTINEERMIENVGETTVGEDDSGYGEIQKYIRIDIVNKDRCLRSPYPNLTENLDVGDKLYDIVWHSPLLKLDSANCDILVSYKKK